MTAILRQFSFFPSSCPSMQVSLIQNPTVCFLLEKSVNLSEIPQAAESLSTGNESSCSAELYPLNSHMSCYWLIKLSSLRACLQLWVFWSNVTDLA